MLLTDINFPIFPIRGYTKLYEESNMLKIDTYVKSWIIDNRNLSGTFSKRRLQMDKKTKYPLTLVIFNISQLISYKSKTNKYIDWDGKLIKYKKRKVVKLKYYLIKGIKKGKSSIALFVENLPFPIYVTYTQLSNAYKFDKLYVGLLEYNGGKLFYNWSTKYKCESWRKI